MICRFTAITIIQKTAQIPVAHRSYVDIVHDKWSEYVSAPEVLHLAFLTRTTTPSDSPTTISNPACKHTQNTSLCSLFTSLHPHCHHLVQASPLLARSITTASNWSSNFLFVSNPVSTERQSEGSICHRFLKHKSGIKPLLNPETPVASYWIEDNTKKFSEASKDVACSLSSLP